MNHEARNTSSRTGGCTLTPVLLVVWVGSSLAQGPGEVGWSAVASPVSGEGVVRDEEGLVLLALFLWNKSLEPGTRTITEVNLITSFH